jgi:hypothetical protein
MQLERDRRGAVPGAHALAQTRPARGDDGHLRHGKDAVEQDEQDDGEERHGGVEVGRHCGRRMRVRR